jgi:hypothetical protein
MGHKVSLNGPEKQGGNSVKSNSSYTAWASWVSYTCIEFWPSKSFAHSKTIIEPLKHESRWSNSQGVFLLGGIRYS